MDTLSQPQPIRKFCHEIATTISPPCLSGVFPSNQQHTKPLLTRTMCLSGSTHKTTHTTIEYSTGKQLSEPHGYQGFPHKTTHITSVWAQTSLWTLLESNFQGTIFIRDSPYKTTHITMWTYTTNTLLESNFQNPMFIRGSPYKTTHITTAWALTTGLFDLKALLENNFRISMFTSVRPLKHKHPLCKLIQTVWVIVPQNTTGNQFSEPPVHQGPPPQHKQSFFGGTEPLRGLIHLKTLLEHTYQSYAYKGFSLHCTNKNCVGTYNHVVYYFTSNNKWKTTFKATCLPGSPSQHKH